MRNKVPDTYFCEFYKNQWSADGAGNLDIGGFTLCQAGVFAYDPWWFSLIVCFIHAAALARPRAAVRPAGASRTEPRPARPAQHTNCST